MMTFSLCMIVKNEAKILKRCLDSICDLMDEIIIVDTGSTDNTVEIAKQYTDKIYYFEWVEDFSKARNFSFSKATMDYIYCADADEYLDENNHEQLKILKENLYPEIDIVQMMYDTVANDTVLNIKKEYRPKLYKRLREFTWVDPIHETVRLEPLVFDSDIVITHEPVENHADRDFSIFQRVLSDTGSLSENVSRMYAIELYKVGKAKDFECAREYFEAIRNIDEQYIMEYSEAILCRDKRINDAPDFINYAETAFWKLKVSEIAFDIGKYWLDKGEKSKAKEWFIRALKDNNPVVDVHVVGDDLFECLIACTEGEQKAHFQELKDNWKNPEENMA